MIFAHPFRLVLERFIQESKCLVKKFLTVLIVCFSRLASHSYNFFFLFFLIAHSGYFYLPPSRRRWFLLSRDNTLWIYCKNWNWIKEFSRFYYVWASRFSFKIIFSFLIFHVLKFPRSIDWTSDRYDLLRHNCNHFSDLLLHVLVGKSIPPWVRKIKQKEKKLKSRAVWIYKHTNTHFFS